MRLAMETVRSDMLQTSRCHHFVNSGSALIGPKGAPGVTEPTNNRVLISVCAN